MWKLVDGQLIQTVDSSRVKFRTNISASILLSLKTLAAENRTHVNYLLESGLINLLNHGDITYNKALRPKDRIQFKTTYDKELLESVKKFAKKHKLSMNDVIEYSVEYIDVHQVKRSNHRYRIERVE